MYRASLCTLAQSISGYGLRKASSMAASRPVVGIDLGTTFSCVAFMDGNSPKLIPDDNGNLTMPSAVALSPSTGDPVHVGHAAVKQRVLDPHNTFFATKRLIGRKYEDKVVQEMAKHVPYTVAAAENGDAWVKCGDRLVSPPEIAAHVLRALKKNAEEYLQQPVEHAVVTVPAYFNDRCACYSARLTLSSQRQATRDAGELAGLQVLRVVNEPTAAALASGIGLNSEDRNIAVYDLGGGTFDVSVLTCGEGFFQVRATNGDTFLGGEDFDTALFEYVFDAGLVGRAELLDDSTTLERLKDLLQQARIDLDSESQVTVNLPFMLRGKDSDTPRSHSFVLTREALDSISKPLVDRTLVPCGNSLRDADMSPEDIHEVVLVGGVSQMPLVRDAVTKMFGCEPKSSINPMHAVGLGAALQAGVLAGKVDDLILVDVTPLSLGIETLDGLFSVLIPRNTKVPTSLTESFSTGVDGQTTVQINVLQGERPLAADNHKLGEFLLTDIPPQAQGKPQIDVTFDINSDGIVRVSAKDKATEKEQRILIEPSSGLTRSHIEAVLEDAKSEKKEDRARVARAQEVANAQAVLRDVEDNLAKFASQLEKEVPEEKAKLEELLSAAWDIVESADQPLKGAMAVQKAAVETFRKAAKSTS